MGCEASSSVASRPVGKASQCGPEASVNSQAMTWVHRTWVCMGAGPLPQQAVSGRSNCVLTRDLEPELAGRLTPGCLSLWMTSAYGTKP